MFNMDDLGFYVFVGMMGAFGVIVLLCAKISDWKAKGKKKAN
ncbi:MAG: hypothetical protein AB1567_05710 [bacterium]